MPLPRFTIARGMIAVAVVAAVLALARSFPVLLGYLLFLVANVGTGWGTWRAC